ncbi:hypothetical protein WA026_017209 [Henosepilachna vigintioctopunctata]|uniref:Elongation of very long chain fatty acids protein n=1 Tax=Henosepilachna vigintioctopunctata TaxID=420089 RepID=A0AAW1UMG2_9CUCU
MMSSPLPTLFICLFYAYFSKVLGPKLMENRKPFHLRNVLIVYNFIQTLFSAWIFYEYLMSGWWGLYSFRCQPVDYSTNPVAMRMANTCWWYYFSKFTEFMDTIFFIMRKKYSQVSTLHVIHHGCMPFSVWMGMKFAPGGHSTFFALLNTFVHIIMYFYYMVSAMGPKYQKFLWWKKYLTTLQIVQFIAIFAHQFQLFFTECNYPKSFMVWIGLHGVLFLFLFSDFYKSKYNSKPSKIDSRVGKNNFGLCMPVLEEEHNTHTHKKTDSNGTLNNTYIKSDLSDSYKACYSNGSTNGFVSQTNVIHRSSTVGDT